MPRSLIFMDLVLVPFLLGITVWEASNAISNPTTVGIIASMGVAASLGLYLGAMMFRYFDWWFTS